MTTAYTHAAHAKACQQAARAGHTLAKKHVQVRKKGVVYCAQIEEAYTTPDGLDCWTVISISPQIARFTVSCKNTVECGFGDCVCASASQKAVLAPSVASRQLDVCADSGADFSGFSDCEFSHGRVVAPRDSLNIEKTPLFAGV